MRRLSPGSDELDLPALLETYAQPAPSVRVNFVASVDGAATVGGRSAGLSSPGDNRLFQVLRALCDVVLVGAGTARVEGYGSVRPPASLQDWRRASGRPAVPRLAVVSGSLALPSGGEVFAAEPIVLTGPDAPADRLAAVQAEAEVEVADSPAGWLHLLAQRGLTRVLCEGGPALFAALLAADLVDELCLTLSPLLAAEGGPGVTRGAGASAPRRLSLVSVLEEDGFLFLRYGAGVTSPPVTALAGPPSQPTRPAGPAAAAVPR